jgi:glycosyltransferase involved in cell wall biosynthesis
VEQANCGIVVPFNDPQAAADAILSLWQEPGKRLQMGASGHKTAAEHYDWTAHAVSFTQELERIARTGR